jgi:hypothetical protein
MANGFIKIEASKGDIGFIIFEEGLVDRLDYKSWEQFFVVVLDSVATMGKFGGLHNSKLF